MPRPLIQRIPNPLRSVLRRIHHFPLDALLNVLHEWWEDLTPPRELIFVGGGNFRKTGDEFLKHFLEIGHVRSGERILDVGCGIGRMAVPLARHFGANITYEGFDIVPAGIEWCREHITYKYSNFQFQLANIQNKVYNPTGTIPASEYRFPYADASFDFALATSVFTHMKPLDMNRYVAETARVLKPNGRLLVTFFLLTAESLKNIESKVSGIDFRHELDGFRTDNLDIPEAAVAYPEKFIRGLFKDHGLSIAEPVHYGSWCGRKLILTYQDLLVAVKI